MNQVTAPITNDSYGQLIEPTTLKIQRMLPGPIERVWSYLIDGELRRKWLASGDITPQAGSTVELVWRNDELTDPPGNKPEGFGTEHRMTSTIIEANPPRRLVFTFGVNGEVAFDLEPKGDKVLLTLVHRRLPDRATMLKVSAGWHAHIGLMVADISGTKKEPFWDTWLRLKDDYDRILPA